MDALLKIGFDAKRFFHNRTGLGNYSRDLIRILSEYAPEIQPVLFNPKPSEHFNEFVPEHARVIMPKKIFYKKFPALWRSKGILQNIKTQSLDIYHGLSGELPIGISRLPVKSIVTIHDLIFMRYPQWYKPWDNFFYRQKFYRTVKEADLIVAISEQTKRDIIRFGQVKPEKIKVIYQGCHRIFKQNYPGQKVKEIKEKYRLPDLFLLYVGTIEPRKNALTIVKALKDLPYTLVLAGRQTPYAEKIKNFVQSNGMQERIRFIQHVPQEDLALLYRAAKVFIYPSVFEGFGIPLIEALYSGTPVITNARGVFPETAGPGGIYLKDIYDTQEMKEKIRFAMESDLSEKTEAGKQFVRRFNDDKLAAQWTETYRSILE